VSKKGRKGWDHLKKIDGNEEVILDNGEAAEVLNKYFNSAFTL